MAIKPDTTVAIRRQRIPTIILERVVEKRVLLNRELVAVYKESWLVIWVRQCPSGKVRKSGISVRESTDLLVKLLLAA